MQTTARKVKQPRAVAQCGECGHVLIGDARYAWCGNVYCPQRNERFVLSLSRPDCNPTPALGVA